jgi:hypothetical protein
MASPIMLAQQPVRIDSPCREDTATRAYLQQAAYRRRSSLSHFPGMFDLSNFEQSWPWQWASLAKEDSLKEAYPPWAISGTKLDGPRWSLAMFQIPACDPVVVVMMGFGLLLAAALAFVL